MSAKAKGPRRAAPRKKEVEAEEAKTKAAEKAEKPVGRIPFPLVRSRHGIASIERRARGFSEGELKEAGLAAPLARAWGVPTDVRRRSVLEANVAAVKKWFTPPKKPETSAPRPAAKAVRKKAPRKKTEE